MELFLTIGVCKVMFCRLMVFYRQYCPMSVFVCVSSLLVPFYSKWFHLQTSEMVLFVTITIANVVFFWAMVLHVQFLPMNFMFFVTVHCWFHLVPGGSSSFQLVPCSSVYVLMYVLNLHNNKLRITIKIRFFTHCINFSNHYDFVSI